MMHPQRVFPQEIEGAVYMATIIGQGPVPVDWLVGRQGYNIYLNRGPISDVWYVGVAPGIGRPDWWDPSEAAADARPVMEALGGEFRAIPMPFEDHARLMFSNRLTVLRQYPIGPGGYVGGVE